VLKKEKQLVGEIAVDLFHDLGMRFANENRRWNYPFLYGEVSITFIALTGMLTKGD
jgi:hypothetical protein